MKTSHFSHLNAICLSWTYVVSLICIKPKHLKAISTKPKGNKNKSKSKAKAKATTKSTQDLQQMHYLNLSKALDHDSPKPNRSKNNKWKFRVNISVTKHLTFNKLNLSYQASQKHFNKCIKALYASRFIVLFSLSLSQLHGLVTNWLKRRAEKHNLLKDLKVTKLRIPSNPLR